jgi:O-antigen/teichoic acid export membrane protein
MAAGVLFFLLMFFMAPLISSFYREPPLLPVIRIIATVLIIDSLTIIQRTILTKRIDFKLQARISIIAGIVSGIISIWMAYKGYGVWSLVAKTIIQKAVNSLLLWVWNRWKPQPVFSMASFRELFGFGSNVLMANLLDTLYRNVYYLVIGKYFSATELGYFTRADRFKALPSENINNVISKVSYPVLSEIKNEKTKLKAGYKRLIKSTMLISFALMIGMAAVAEPMVLTLIGEKWYPSIIYLQMLCFIGMMYPLNALNMNILLVKGRSDLSLRLEIIKKLFAIPVIVVGIIWGMKIMIAGMMVNTVISYWLNSYWSGKLVDYPITEQVADISPSFGISVFSGVLVYFMSLLIRIPALYMLIIQVMTGGLIIFLFCEKLKLEEYFYIKNLVKEKIVSFRNA